jgi:hypothetical protein
MQGCLVPETEYSLPCKDDWGSTSRPNEKRKAARSLAIDALRPTKSGFIQHKRAEVLWEAWVHAQPRLVIQLYGTTESIELEHSRLIKERVKLIGLPFLAVRPRARRRLKEVESRLDELDRVFYTLLSQPTPDYASILNIMTENQKHIAEYLQVLDERGCQGT